MRPCLYRNKVQDEECLLEKMGEWAFCRKVEARIEGKHNWGTPTSLTIDYLHHYHCKQHIFRTFYCNLYPGVITKIKAVNFLTSALCCFLLGSCCVLREIRFNLKQIDEAALGGTASGVGSGQFWETRCSPFYSTSFHQRTQNPTACSAFPLKTAQIR